MKSRHISKSEEAANRRLQIEYVVRDSVRGMTPDEFETYFDDIFKASRAIWDTANQINIDKHPFGGGSIGELAITRAVTDRQFILELPCRGKRLKDWLTAQQRADVVWNYFPTLWNMRDLALETKQRMAQDAVDDPKPEDDEVMRLLIEATRDTLSLSDQVTAAPKPDTFEGKLLCITSYIELLDQAGYRPRQ